MKLEIAKQYPDAHLGTGYQFDQGENKWALGLSVEIPVLNRNQGPIAETEAKRGEAAARVLALQARIVGEVDRCDSCARGAGDRGTRDRATRAARRRAGSRHRSRRKPLASRPPPRAALQATP